MNPTADWTRETQGSKESGTDWSNSNSGTGSGSDEIQGPLMSAPTVFGSCIQAIRLFLFVSNQRRLEALDTGWVRRDEEAEQIVRINRRLEVCS